MRRLITAACAIALLAVTPAQAHDGSLRHDANHEWRAAQKRCDDKRTPGRNIAVQGLRNGKEPSRSRLSAWKGTLDGLCRPSVPVQSSGAVSSRDTTTSGSHHSSVIDCESGGNAQAVSPDGSYWGLYQFDRQTWVAHGGSPSSYGSAPAAEQHAVASRVNYDAWPNC